MATEKLKALTHFIIHECGDNPGRLGATRLNKALWKADVLAYKAIGQSVTGDTYVKRQNGPVPAEVLATLRELRDAGAIHIREPQHRYDPRRFVSLADPDIALLSDTDQDIARLAINYVCGKSTSEVSDETHDVVWEAAGMGEEIPLYATLAGRKGEVTLEIADWALEVIEGRSGPDGDQVKEAA